MSSASTTSTAFADFEEVEEVGGGGADDLLLLLSVGVVPDGFESVLAVVCCTSCWVKEEKVWDPEGGESGAVEDVESELLLDVRALLVPA